MRAVQEQTKQPAQITVHVPAPIIQQYFPLPDLKRPEPVMVKSTPDQTGPSYDRRTGLYVKLVELQQFGYLLMEIFRQQTHDGATHYGDVEGWKGMIQIELDEHGRGEEWASIIKDPPNPQMLEFPEKVRQPDDRAVYQDLWNRMYQLNALIGKLTREMQQGVLGRRPEVIR